MEELAADVKGCNIVAQSMELWVLTAGASKTVKLLNDHESKDGEVLWLATLQLWTLSSWVTLEELGALALMFLNGVTSLECTSLTSLAWPCRGK